MELSDHTLKLCFLFSKFYLFFNLVQFDSSGEKKVLHLFETINRKIIIQGTLTSNWMAVQKLSQINYYHWLTNFYSASIGKAKPNNPGHFSIRRSQAPDPSVCCLSSSLCVCVERKRNNKVRVCCSELFVHWQCEN